MIDDSHQAIFTGFCTTIRTKQFSHQAIFTPRFLVFPPNLWVSHQMSGFAPSLWFSHQAYGFHTKFAPSDGFPPNSHQDQTFTPNSHQMLV
jgi:hypothetical protein